MNERLAITEASRDNQHHRPAGEISYDLVMDEDMDFAEGSYRIRGGDWCVFVFLLKRPLENLSWKHCVWESGVSGMVVHVPLGMVLNMSSIESLLSEVLGVGKWERVRGPDSMQLR